MDHTVVPGKRYLRLVAVHVQEYSVSYRQNAYKVFCTVCKITMGNKPTHVPLTAAEVREKWKEEEMRSNKIYLLEFQKAVKYFDLYYLKKGVLQSHVFPFWGSEFNIARKMEERFMNDLKESFESRGFRALVTRCRDDNTRFKFELTFADTPLKDMHDEPPTYMENTTVVK